MPASGPDSLTSEPQQGPPRRGGLYLKAAIFATGLAGIVAEYVMATLASYLLGNSVVQWTLTISLMLFAMGVGSRISRRIVKHELETFVAVEFGLSLLCAFGPLTAYALYSQLDFIYLVIYGFAIGIGLLIGIEIPLVTRLNSVFEELRINISSVMEQDYYGALLGGIVFAFLALPYLGLTYTPILLGAVNFVVAFVLLWRFRSRVTRFRLRASIGVAVFACLIVLAFSAEPIVQFGEQKKYLDKVVYSEQSAYQRIVITEWRGNHWLYLNGEEQFSTFDEKRYHEPLVLPAMAIAAARKNVLILGGGDGLALREVLKHHDVERALLVDLDPAMTDLARTHPVLTAVNDSSLYDARVEVINRDGFTFMAESDQFYDVIIIDLPDPRSVDLGRLYTLEFYRGIKQHLSAGGVVVTQAGSPFFAPEAFACIHKTMRHAGFAVLAYHNHIPTMGEWGWVLGMNAAVGDSALRIGAEQLEFDHTSTSFLTSGSMSALLHFGKGLVPDSNDVEVNTLHSQILPRYYRAGRWDVY